MRARRLAAFAIDLLLAGAPWWAWAGSVVVTPPSHGMGGIGASIALLAACTLGSLAVVVAQIALYVGAGRTPGMGAVRLVARGGVRVLSVFLGAVLLGASFGAAAFFAQSADQPTTVALYTLAPVAAVALDLAFLVGPQARTLLDRATGVRVEREAPAPGPRRWGALGVDAVFAVGAGLPLALAVTDLEEFAGAAAGSALALCTLGLAQIVLLAATRTTIAMRALGVASAGR